MAVAVLACGSARAQMDAPSTQAPSSAALADSNDPAPFGAPVGDTRTYLHGRLDEFEGRLGAESAFRWEGEGWAGDDFNRVWVKSEGEVTRGRTSDGQQELFYDRPITTYFDLQAGARYDLDSGPGRGWGAIGIEGYAPFYAVVSGTLYAGDGGRYAAKLQASDEIRFTQRLILEPQAELNLYTRADPVRDVRSGLSDLDAGLRLRYELSRKIAPYVGLTYERQFAHHQNGASLGNLTTSSSQTNAVRFTVGIRGWF